MEFLLSTKICRHFTEIPLFSKVSNNFILFWLQFLNKEDVDFLCHLLKVNGKKRR